MAVASLPSKPSAVVKDQSSSSLSSISVRWTALGDTQPVVGYLVYMADISSGGSYQVVYDGSANPIRLTYTAYLLTPGKSYGFVVQALNFNGKGEMSDEAIFKSCKAPSGFTSVKIGEVSESTVSLVWQPPSETGG